MESDLQKQNIILPSSTKINTQIFAFEQVMIACPEENLQTEIFILQKVTKNFGIEISTEKTETNIYFSGQVPVRYKMVVDKNVYNKKEF